MHAKNVLIFSDGTGQVGEHIVSMSTGAISTNFTALRGSVRIPLSIRPSGEEPVTTPASVRCRRVAGRSVLMPRMAHNFLSQATGFGLTANIIDCYKSIIHRWRPGDRIYLFGFSRGAYTARCIGGVLALCGVPTQLENGAPMKYDSGTAHPLATVAVKKVYPHAA